MASKKIEFDVVPKLKKEMEKCMDLTKEERDKLEELLKKYEDLFNEH